MKLKTTRFGDIDVKQEELIYFRYGLLGFEHCHRFALIRPNGESPFLYLQSADEPDLTFVVTQPLWFRPDYQVQVKQEDLKELKADGIDQIAVYAIVTVPKDPTEMTVNLLAPLLVNTETRTAKQLVQAEGPYHVRHKLSEEIERLQQMTKERKGALTQDEKSTVSPLRTVG